MNRKLNKYVNYLFDNAPSPFCDYIISKELLKEDEQTVRSAYEWAIRFKLYEELSKEQLPDGSWGGFDTAHTELIKKDKRKYKATARAITRILDLSLEGIDDPMVNKTIGVMKKYLTGELPDPEFYGKNNIYKPVGIRQQIIQNLSFFEPENPFVAELRNLAAEFVTKACKNGSFNKNVWNTLKYKYNGLDVGLCPFTISMLSYGNIISDNVQRMILAAEWESGDFLGAWTKACDIKTPENPSFIFWVVTLERLQKFSLFNEFAAEKVEPHLYSICEQILNDSSNQMEIKINNYFYHQGQYSDARNTKQKKKNDLLLQVIRILNNCTN